MSSVEQEWLASVGYNCFSKLLISTIDNCQAIVLGYLYAIANLVSILICYLSFMYTDTKED